MRCLTKYVNSVKSGTLPDSYGRDEENHTLSGENRHQDPSHEALIEMTWELGLTEKEASEKSIVCAC